MYQLIKQFQTTTLCLRNLMNRSSRHRGTVAALLLMFALACFALSPQARAACEDGCLANANTVLGDFALSSLTTGASNTAIGFDALLSNTTGSDNTAVGYIALDNNTTGLNNTATGFYTLATNTTGNSNTATGASALRSNT